MNLYLSANEIEAALPETALREFSELPFHKVASGKVREIYDTGDAFLIIASDRLSAFDVILPDGIPGKGIILTQMSLYWFDESSELIQNHLDLVSILAGLSGIEDQIDQDPADLEAIKTDRGNIVVGVEIDDPL